jgi:CheY-like chemotaxis protein
MAQVDLVKPLRWLVVDDEPMIAVTVANQLCELGYEIAETATTMERARRLAANSQIDAALLDLNLHGQVTDEIGDIPATRAIPFALMTGYSNAAPGTFVDVLILRKPFSDADLKRTVEAILAKSSTISRAA